MSCIVGQLDPSPHIKRNEYYGRVAWKHSARLFKLIRWCTVHYKKLGKGQENLLTHNINKIQNKRKGKSRTISESKDGQTKNMFITYPKKIKNIC